MKNYINLHSNQQLLVREHCGVAGIGRLLTSIHYLQIPGQLVFVYNKL